MRRWWFNERAFWLRVIIATTGFTLSVASPAEPQIEARDDKPLTATAEASTDPALTEPQKQHIEIVVVGSADQLTQAQSAVALWRLGAHDVSWHQVERFDPESFLARGSAPNDTLHCIIDFSPPQTIQLYFTNPSTHRFLVRSLETSGRFDELEREALGQTVELSLLALLQNQEAGLSREDTQSLLVFETPSPDEPVPSTAPTAATTRALALEFGAYYEAALWLDRTPFVHGPGFVLNVAFSDEPMLVAWGQGRAYWPAEWHDDLASLKVRAQSLRLGGELRPLLARWNGGKSDQRLAIRAGGGLEVIGIQPQAGSDDTAVTLTESRRRIELVFTVGVESLTRLSSWFALRAGLLADFTPRRTRYEVELNGERHVVFAATPLRPGVLVGANFVLD